MNRKVYYYGVNYTPNEGIQSNAFTKSYFISIISLFSNNLLSFEVIS